MSIPDNMLQMIDNARLESYTEEGSQYCSMMSKLDVIFGARSLVK